MCQLLLCSWSKERRFQLVWEHIAKLQPSMLLQNEAFVGFKDASSLEKIYARLERGEILTALISYEQEP